VIRANGEMATDPQFAFSGVPEFDQDGDSFTDIAEKAAFGAFDSIPRARRKDPDLVGEAVRKSVRAAINNAWGKKPICTVLVSVV
jgi:ribonuclease J